MRYIGLMIWENGQGQSVCQLIEDDYEERPKYFESAEEVKKAVNPDFPCLLMVINIDTSEVVG